METVDRNAALKTDLLNRRQRLGSAVPAGAQRSEIQRLIADVDAALQRMEAGTYGLCESCGDPVEGERLAADPLARFCIDHLSAREQNALERDLQLASRVQRALLPNADVQVPGWDVRYHYEPAGVVSGDYCDVVARDNGDLFFIVGDVSGKGVAASILTGHLHASFRTLVALGLSVRDLVDHVNRLFCESTMDAHYATLVCGRASPSGDLELCIAGHVPPLVVRDGKVAPIDVQGFPIGIFCAVPFTAHTLRLAPGNLLFLYTDGLSDARNASDEDYGVERIVKMLERHACRSTQELVQAWRQEIASFRGDTPRADDLTFMVIRRR